MKFDQIPNSALIHFNLPGDHPDTADVRDPHGCAKGQKKDLKRSCPRGEAWVLRYDAAGFIFIELRATFYHSADPPAWGQGLSPVPRILPVNE